jgi:2-iminobutanoate/2-iminopropanoate deaminase
MEVAWTNLLAILRAAGMTADHLVKITVFITDPADVALVRQVRDRHIGRTPPASTLLVVAGLARPDFRFELEAVAAMPDRG